MFPRGKSNSSAFASNFLFLFFTLNETIIPLVSLEINFVNGEGKTVVDST